MNVPPQGNAQEFFPNLFASANQGYAPAQIILAAWYETATTNAEMQTVLFQSSGQPASCWACQVEAHKWASVAESQGVESMREMLVNLAQSMSEEQLEEAKKRAKALLETHTLAPPKTP